MNKTRIFAAAIAAVSLSALLPFSANADDAPSPCASLKRIVAAAPGGLASLTPEDGKGVAQPYGDDAQCSASHGSYQCMWTPHHDAGSLYFADRTKNPDVKMFTVKPTRLFVLPQIATAPTKDLGATYSYLNAGVSTLLMTTRI